MQSQETAQWNNQQQQQNSAQPGSAEEVKTLWMGDLIYWMDENYLWSIFGQTGDVTSVKIIRNKMTGQSEGYGFVEFVNKAAAERALLSFGSQTMPQTEQQFRLNWATFGGSSDRRQDAGNDFSIFVGDLSSDVNDYVLMETFKTKFTTIKGAKVVIDIGTGRSKGYGFVRFGSEEERDRALNEMNGQYCSSRPMRISLATPKKATAGQGTRSTDPSDSNNSTIFVGGLDPSITDEQLRATFAPFGELVYVKIPYGRGCGFVQFQTRASAEEAIKTIHGTVIGQNTVRLSWGRSPNATKDVTAAAWAPNPAQPYYAYGAYDPNYVYPTANDPNASYYAGYYQPQYQQPIPQTYPAPNGVGYQAGYYPPTANGAPKETESFNPGVPPNVEKMNQTYMSGNNPSRAPHMWLKPSDQVST